MAFEVDEEAIRSKVLGREFNVHVTTDRYTPSGRPRSAPLYEAAVGNTYLGTSRVFKGRDEQDVVSRARKQLETWAQQEMKHRVAEANADATERARAAAEDAAQDARDQYEAVRSLLAATLTVNDRIDWASLMDRKRFPEFAFPEHEPVQPVDPHPPLPLKPSFWEKLFSSLRAKRLAREAQAHEEHRAICEEAQRRWRFAHDAWQARRQQAAAEYEKNRKRFYDDQRKRNEATESFRQRFEQGEPAAVVEYLKEVFERSEYPKSFSPEHEVAYDPASHTAIVDLTLPAQSDVPDVIDFKFTKATREAKPVRLKQKEHDDLYDSVVKQTVLRTIHEVFEAVYTPHVQICVVNGWVTSLDKSTGNDETSCVISVSAEHTEFEALNLARIDPSECIKKLKGLIAGPLSQVAPVKPIMQLDRNDPRFVESRAVLAELNSATNLAEIPWEEFEHLVRELFEKMFAGQDTEVRVTQASRDGGVDAVAFDPDPIRGGKYVIQAKRYTNVVPVSAVRDLYGTMISEGAAKGILVTTAHFGKDARTFVKDKPITLIDGSNLVYLLEKHGHKVRIDVTEAKSKATGTANN